MAPRKNYRHRPITAATILGTLCLILPILSFVHLYIHVGTLWPFIYTCGLSAVTFVLYGYDKLQARNNQWRVKETTLHLWALLGGWPGAMVGMHYFQHKTRKRAFLVVFWGIVVVWEGFWWVVWRADLKLMGYRY